MKASKLLAYLRCLTLAGYEDGQYVWIGTDKDWQKVELEECSIGIDADWATVMNTIEKIS